MNIWLQIKFRHYIIKTKESILNTQYSRIKTQESRKKKQESTVHRQGSQAWPNSLASRPPIRDGLSRRTPMGSGLRNTPLSQSFPDYIQSEHQSVHPGSSTTMVSTKDESQYQWVTLWPVFKIPLFLRLTF